MTDAITMSNAHKVFDFMQQTAKELTGWGLQFHTFSPFWPQGETKLILEMYYGTPPKVLLLYLGVDAAQKKISIR